MPQLLPGTIVTLQLRVLKHKPPPRGNNKAPYKVTCEDDTGRIDLVFFHAERKFIEKQLPVGELRFVSGRIERYGEALQMAHPDYIVSPEARDELPMLEPVYPLTAGLSGKVMVKAARQAVERVPDLPEWQEARWLEARGWPDFKAALVRVHQPSDAQDVSNGGAPWQRLAYDELLAGQLAFALVRQNGKAERGRRLAGDGRIRARISEALPFSLTGSQRTALEEIAADLAAPHRMLRLLQGDVGSGKTVVALLAMAIAVEAGAQAALMAPTEVLARQHLETIAPLAEAAGLRIALLTGREKGKARDNVLSRLAAGEIDILIGTHALFQSDVLFKDLAVAVIDEQHRFGVHQRLGATGKRRQRRYQRVGDDGDAYSAHTSDDALRRPRCLEAQGKAGRTKADRNQGGAARNVGAADRPHPRTAQRRCAGLLGLPVDRKFGGDRSRSGRRALRLLAPDLRRSASDCCTAGLPPRKKTRRWRRSRPGKSKSLLRRPLSKSASTCRMPTSWSSSTPSGSALPNCISSAAASGGARASPSACCSINPRSARRRASASAMMERTEDGFLIAEKDLELRGGGEILGARQSGAPGFRVAEVPGFEMLLTAARDDAGLMLANDPGLVSARGQALRTLLYLFECDEAVRLFRAA